MSRGSRLLTTALDSTLMAALVVVPAGLSPDLRSFGTAKVLLLELLVGVAVVLAGFVPARSDRTDRGLMIGTALLGATIALRPNAEGLAAAGYLVSCAALLWLLRPRVHAWSSTRLLAVVGVPLAIGLAWSLAQSMGVGILEATHRAFGTTHGRAVGTVGNPTENTWYLLLAAMLLWAPVEQRRTVRVWAAAAMVAVAVVIVVDRARATALVGGAVLAAGLMRRHAHRRSIIAALVVLGAAVAVGLAWGGAEALRGRWFLGSVGLRMLVGARGLPQGPGAYGRDFPTAQAEALREHPEATSFESFLDHAHLDPLELTYDFGLLALCAAGAWLGLVVRAWRHGAPGRSRTAAGVLLAGAGLSLLGYPLYSPACAVVLVLASALVLSPGRTVPTISEPDPARVPPGRAIVASVLGVGLMLLAIHQWRAERSITAALQARAEGRLVQGRALARAAVRHYPSADALLVLGNFELETGAASAAVLAYERSVALRPRPQALHNLRLAQEAVQTASDRQSDVRASAR